MDTGRDELHPHCPEYTPELGETTVKASKEGFYRTCFYKVALLF